MQLEAVNFFLYQTKFEKAFLILITFAFIVKADKY